VPKKVPQGCHNGSHIARRKDRYWYRRRIPGMQRREICVSLRTRHYREAEHRAALLDQAFGDALRRAQANVTDSADLNAILRDYLRAFLERDLNARMERPSGAPVYGWWWYPGDPGTATEADLQAIRQARDSLKYDLATNSPKEMEEEAAELIKQYGLPESLLRPLTYGLLEATIQGWEIAERRTLGTEPLVFAPTPPSAGPANPDPSSPAPPAKPPGPLASSLLEDFAAWARTSGGWRGNAENQAKGSLGLFLEICGDKPIERYTRADADTFRTTLRKLPSIYRKSARDREKPIAQIIAEAGSRNAPRLAEKTVKRHFWALSRFCAFLMETGRLPRDADNLGRGFTFNTKGVTRKQRDMWTGEELRRLFASPVWSGCHPFFRARAGDQIIKDALFWLPLLGLFHGNRLEEFAQVRRGDIGRADGVWYLDITDEDGRQLKNEQSRRKVPLHPELIRVGFLDYVAETTASPKDQVFPELKPGGKDQKLGYYFSKEFSRYRESIGVRRRGLDYHSFRHGVTTKLYEAGVSEAFVDLLTGHESGGESRRRYLKGISLPQLRAAIERVQWPEVDLSRLYLREVGDERWPVKEAPAAA
jgi:integrase